MLIAVVEAAGYFISFNIYTDGQYTHTEAWMTRRMDSSSDTDTRGEFNMQSARLGSRALAVDLFSPLSINILPSMWTLPNLGERNNL